MTTLNTYRQSFGQLAASVFVHVSLSLFQQSCLKSMIIETVILLSPAGTSGRYEVTFGGHVITCPHVL